MSAKLSVDDFNAWLNKKLSSLNPAVDTDTFLSYMLGILNVNDEQGQEECQETIQEIVQEITETNAEEHAAEIMKKWKETQDEKKNEEAKPALEDKLTSLMEKHAQEATVKPKKEMTKDQLMMKRAILSQYGNLPDGEASDGDDEPWESMKGNINAQAVMEREKEVREHSKVESEKKKAKDKEDREKQKQKAQDRKEAEHKRTQKGERRA